MTSFATLLSLHLLHIIDEGPRVTNARISLDDIMSDQYKTEDFTGSWISGMYSASSLVCCVLCVVSCVSSLHRHHLRDVGEDAFSLTLFNKWQSKSSRRMHASHSMDWNVIWRWIQWKCEKARVAVLFFCLFSSVNCMLSSSVYLLPLSLCIMWQVEQTRALKTHSISWKRKETQRQTHNTLQSVQVLREI